MSHQNIENIFKNIFKDINFSKNFEKHMKDAFKNASDFLMQPENAVLLAVKEEFDSLSASGKSLVSHVMPKEYSDLVTTVKVSIKLNIGNTADLKKAISDAFKDNVLVLLDDSINFSDNAKILLRTYQNSIDKEIASKLGTIVLKYVRKIEVDQNDIDFLSSHNFFNTFEVLVD